MTQKHQITAIIYDKKGRVLSVGQNSYVKTHPLQAHYAQKTGNEHKLFLHAEVHAITRCQDLTKAHRIAIFRYNKNGEPRLAKPCQVCDTAILATPIKIVEHT
jgi:deoxycytidylate deaminase